MCGLVNRLLKVVVADDLLFSYRCFVYSTLWSWSIKILDGASFHLSSFLSSSIRPTYVLHVDYRTRSTSRSVVC